MNNEMPIRLALLHADEKCDCEQSSGCGHHDKEKNQEPAEILLLRYFAYFALWCRQNCDPIKRKDNDSDCIPTRNRCTSEPTMSSHGTAALFQKVRKER